MMNKNFAVFILTNKRPNKVITYKNLRKSGYTGKIYLIVDDEDQTINEYKKNFPNEVIVFDKKQAAKTFDVGDNFKNRRGVIYARNASFEIAKKLKIDYFLQLDDDYTNFSYRFDDSLNYLGKTIKNLDHIFDCYLNFLKNTNTHSIAFSQGGDFIGGSGNIMAQKVKLTRKCMNSFFCSTERKFDFIGRINEDVNSYTRLASVGYIFFTSNQVSLTQKQTQTNSGGMTELYLDSGTYVKSFYSVIFQPSSVKVKYMKDGAIGRIHHSVDWKYTAPKILSEKYKKKI